MTTPLKVGVVGVGHLGKEHARIYRDLPEAELVGISDLDPAKEDKAKELGTVYYKDFRDLLGKAEAVSIATPGTFVHCSHGQDRTGLLVGLYRLKQGWAKTNAYTEMLTNGFHPALHGLHEFWENAK